MSVRLYFWQRVTAVLLAPMVVVHLGLILYVIHYRLTAAEILSHSRELRLGRILHRVRPARCRPCRNRHSQYCPRMGAPQGR